MAERSRKYRAASAFARPGWCPDRRDKEHLPGGVDKEASHHFLGDAATPPRGDARRGITPAPTSHLRRAVLACRDNAVREAARRPSRFRARNVARDLDGDALRPNLARERSRCACFLVRAVAVPFLGGLSLTPARRAFERPIAIACFVDRAPCFPLRTCSISS